jgi:glutathione S-transferase
LHARCAFSRSSILSSLSLVPCFLLLVGTKWITKGLDALEAKAQARLASYPSTAYLVGAEPTVADACLIPQLYNARRFNVPLDPYRFPRLLAVEKALAVLPAFVAAHANNQPDAEL